jgi:hypothetical protein
LALHLQVSQSYDYRQALGLKRTDTEGTAELQSTRTRKLSVGLCVMGEECECTMHALHDIKPRSEVFADGWGWGCLARAAPPHYRSFQATPQGEAWFYHMMSGSNALMAKRCTAPQPCYSGHLG